MQKSILGPPAFTPADQEAFQAIWDAGMAEHGRALEASRAGRLYRQELARRRLPQPDSLAGIEVIEDLLRLMENSDSGQHANTR